MLHTLTCGPLYLMKIVQFRDIYTVAAFLPEAGSLELYINATMINKPDNKIKSNHFYCHITTAQVPW